MLKIIQISDLHILGDKNDRFFDVDTRANFKKIIKTTINPDLLILTGDLSQDGTKESYQFIAEQITNKFIWLPGNHDDEAVAAKILGARQRELLLDNWHFILLNSHYSGHESGLLAKTELKFLDKNLAKHTNKHVIIFLHHHVLPTGSLWLDTMMLENHAEFHAIINKYKHIKIVAYGHIHQGFCVKKQGITFISSPATSIQFKPKTQQLEFDDLPPGYRWFELYDNGEFITDVVRDQIAPATAYNGYDLTASNSE